MLTSVRERMRRLWPFGRGGGLRRPRLRRGGDDGEGALVPRRGPRRPPRGGAVALELPQPPVRVEAHAAAQRRALLARLLRRTRSLRGPTG